MTLLHGADPARAGVACLFLHGRTQTPEEMVSGVVARVAAPMCHWQLPRAAGKSWYDAKAVDPMSDLTARQLSASLDLVAQELAALAAAGIPAGRVVLAGFSQGACVALEYALQRGGGLGGLCLFTGCRVGGALGGVALPGLPVYAGCGDADPWIPLPAFMQGLHSLAEAGARLRAEVFPGRAHQVSDPEANELAGMLAALAGGRGVIQT